MGTPCQPGSTSCSSGPVAGRYRLVVLVLGVRVFIISIKLLIEIALGKVEFCQIVKLPISSILAQHIRPQADHSDVFRHIAFVVIYPIERRPSWIVMIVAWIMNLDPRENGADVWPVQVINGDLELDTAVIRGLSRRPDDFLIWIFKISPPLSFTDLALEIVVLLRRQNAIASFGVTIPPMRATLLFRRSVPTIGQSDVHFRSQALSFSSWGDVPRTGGSHDSFL
jgi:hypothetical protein